MRRLVWAVAVWLAVMSATAAPVINCDTPVYDFGMLKDAMSVKHKFTIKNIGDQVLNVGRLRPCCGATMTIAAKTLDPGASTTVSVMLHVRNRQGPQEKSFYIGSNDPQTPYYRVSLVGTLVRSVTVTPTFVDFGRILAGQEGEKDQVITIRCDEPEGFEIKELQSSTNCFSAKRLATTGDVHRISVRVASPLSPGVTRGRIMVQTTHPKYAMLHVPLWASAMSDVQVVPREIVLVAGKAMARPDVRYVAVRSRSKQAFAIQGVDVPDANILMKHDAIGAHGYRCRFEGLLPFEDLDGEAIIIKTSHKGAKEIRVAIRVISRKEVE